MEIWLVIGRSLGAGIALGFGGIGAAFGMGIAAGQATEGMMRQPARQGHILRTMLIGQAVGGSPSIFALVVGLLIAFWGGGEPEAITGTDVFAFIAGGIAIGLACFGSGAGCGYPAGAACDAVARNPRRTSQATSVMVIGQAVCQTPAVFGLLIAFIILFALGEAEDTIVWWAKLVAAGISVGFGGIGPGIGSGIAAGSGCQAMSVNPRKETLVLRTMLTGQAISQSTAIYALIIALVILFVV